MNKLKEKLQHSKLRSHRVRQSIKSESGKPRLSVFISNKHVSAQLIDDQQGKTIAYATTVGKKDDGDKMTDKAASVGADIAKKAKKAKVNQVVFDRGSRLYHGRVKALADAARQEGLKF